MISAAVCSRELSMQSIDREGLLYLLLAQPESLAEQKPSAVFHHVGFTANLRVFWIAQFYTIGLKDITITQPNPSGYLRPIVKRRQPPLLHHAS